MAILCPIIKLLIPFRLLNGRSAREQMEWILTKGSTNRGATFNPFTFIDFNAAALNTTIPSDVPAGQVRSLLTSMRLRENINHHVLVFESTWSALNKSHCMLLIVDVLLASLKLTN